MNTYECKVDNSLIGIEINKIGHSNNLKFLKVWFISGDEKFSKEVMGDILSKFKN